MGEERIAAGKGLGLVFWGQILLVLSVVLACLEGLGPVVTIAYLVLDVGALVVAAVGLSQAMAAHSGYRMALFLTVVVGACDVVALAGSWVYLLLRGASAVVAYMAMAYVCDSTVQLCPNDRGLAALEGKARQLYLGCSATVVLCQVLSVLTFLGDMGGFFNLCARFVQGVGYLYYLYFLHQAGKKLR